MRLGFKSQLISDVAEDIRKQTRCLLGGKKKLNTLASKSKP